MPDRLTQGTNQVGTSHQEVAPTGNGGVQTLQGSSEQTPGTATNQIQYNPGPSVQHVQQLAGQSQNQMINFGTLDHIPSSTQKIAPSIQRIHRDIDPYVYNQRLQVASQQRTQQIEIPQGYHYGTDYNILHMIPNPRYQGTRDFNPQMGQQVQRNPNSRADELLLKVTEMMKNQFGLKPKGLTFSYKRPYPE